LTTFTNVERTLYCIGEVNLMCVDTVEPVEPTEYGTDVCV